MKKNDYPTQDTLEIEVANFGPIIEAKIDLRPLTVFIGPSNTGKSYLAILIYALHRYFSGSPWRKGLLWTVNSRKLPPKIITALTRLAQQTFADKSEAALDRTIVLPSALADEICSVLDAQGDQLGNEIGRSFGLKEVGTLIRKGKRDSARIIVQKRFAPDSAPVEYRLVIRAKKVEFRTTLPKGTPIRVDVAAANRAIEYLRHMVPEMISVADQTEEQRQFSEWDLVESLADLVRSQLVAPLHLPAFYLPADRTGVMHAHSVVVSALIGNAPMAGLRPTPSTPMLSGVLADFLQQLIELKRPPFSRRKPRRELSRNIEKSILGGSVHADSSGAIGYPYFTYQPEGWKDELPLMNASSMVSELAPVVLYLRHMVVPDNVLIVEEPESHLHPAMQVEFTRQLAALVESGIRVIVTTHSEWVLEELANIVRRSKLSEAKRKSIAGGDFALSSDQVGAWLFKPKRHPKGSVVTEIGLNDSGLYPSGFDDVAVALHNDWADISSRIGEAE